MSDDNRLMILEKQVHVLMSRVSQQDNMIANLRQDYGKALDDIQVLKNTVKLNAKNSESERVARNNLNKDSMRFTAAAKEGGFRSAAHMNAQLEAIGVMIMVGKKRVPVKKMADDGYFEKQNGQWFVTRKGMDYIRALISAGIIRP